MAMDKIRRAILARIEERGIDMKQLSVKLGRNEAYIQQFIRRGSPRVLGEKERHKLADLLDLTEEDLGASVAPARAETTIPNLTIHGGMGNGGLEHVELDRAGTISDRYINGFWSFPDSIQATVRNPGKVHALPVVGDSMSPVLEGGSIVFVDTTHTHPAPQDIYAVDYGDGLVIKQIELVPRTSKIKVISANKEYGSYEMERDDVRVYGRVVGYFRWRG